MRCELRLRLSSCEQAYWQTTPRYPSRRLCPLIAVSCGTLVDSANQSADIRSMTWLKARTVYLISKAPYVFTKKADLFHGHGPVGPVREDNVD
jgi:hypothetical protein